MGNGDLPAAALTPGEEPDTSSPPPPPPQQQQHFSVGDISATLTRGGRFVRYNILGNIFEVTSRYRPPIKPIGKGAYGLVCSAVDSETDDYVAVKKITNAFDNKIDSKRTLREIKLLRHMDHENIVSIRDVIPPLEREKFNDVYLVYDLMDTDLHQIIHSNQPLTEEHFQYFLYQILRGLKYIHSANVLHRDLKPSNILLNANCDLKICDFRLAWVTSESDFMTEYVVTRWYRPPELLLNSSDYSAAIDIWSAGCIFMELMDHKPLFPGRDHVHQLRLLIELNGTPSEDELCLLNENANRYIRQLPRYQRQQFTEKFPHVNPLAIDLVEKMLKFDPRQRVSEVHRRNLAEADSLSMELETLNHVLGLVEAFRAFDSDNDGWINAQELRGIMGSLGYTSMTEQDVQGMMQDGVLSMSEFLEMNTGELELGELAAMKTALEGMELEEHDLVTGEDLYSAVANMAGLELSLNECHDVVASVDGDGDGAITYADFMLILNTLVEK